MRWLWGQPLCLNQPTVCCLCCRGLLYCMEYLEDNLEEWLGSELEAFGDDDYLLFVSGNE